MSNTQTAVNQLVRKPLPEPKKWPWVQDELSQYLIQKTYKDLGPNHVAFVLRRIGTLAGDIYKMFINSTKPEDLQKYLECHEAGHIIFGHNSGEKTKDRINKMKIRAAWPKVQDKFKSREAWEKRFDSLIYNIVMDMEVNSKMFDKSEWVPFSNDIGGGIWPEDFGFPVGLDYNTYLNLLLQDPRKFLDDLKNEMNKNQNEEGNGESQEGEGQADGDDESQEGEGSSSGDGSEDGDSEDGKSEEAGDGNSSGENDDKSSKGKGKSSDSDKESDGDGNGSGAFSEDDLADLEKYFEENSEEKQEEVAKKLEDAEKNLQAALSKEFSHGRGRGNSSKALPVLENENFDTLESNLTKLLSKSAVVNKRDQLYNYNRNKHNSNVIIPKVTKMERSVPACMYVLLDVSGSISTHSVAAFCKAFSNVSQKLNKKSRIILWNTELVSDNLAKDNIYPEAGGGTDMAQGIKYIKSHYNPKKDDYFVMVSDFQDNLEAWNHELKTLKSNKLAYIFNYDNEENASLKSYIEQKLILDEVRKLWKNTKKIDL